MVGQNAVKIKVLQVSINTNHGVVFKRQPQKPFVVYVTTCGEDYRAGYIVCGKRA